MQRVVSRALRGTGCAVDPAPPHLNALNTLNTLIAETPETEDATVIALVSATTAAAGTVAAPQLTGNPVTARETPPATRLPRWTEG